MEPTSRRLIFALAALITLAGCLALEDDPLPPRDDTPTENSTNLSASLTVLEDGTLEATLPTHVVLAGFEDDVDQTLTERLDTERVNHAWANWPPATPQDPSDPRPPGLLTYVTPVGFEWRAPPLVPIADYNVHPAPTSLEDEIQDTLENATSQSGWHANPIEQDLTTLLPEHGIPANPDAPTLVILHAANLLDEPLGEHAYTYELTHGALETVRLFGETEPLLVMDASAQEDPWRNYCTYEGQTQDDPCTKPSYAAALEPTGQDTANALEEAVRNATHYRLLQGASMKPPVATCHDITVILATRGLADAQNAPDPSQLAAPDAWTHAFQNLTPGTVTVDATTLALPEDDPGLDALTRETVAQRQTFRAWADANWDDYHEGSNACEEYLKILVLGDQGDQYEAVAIYDEQEDRRVSLSVLPGNLWASAGEDGTQDIVTHLVLHETGHLFGLGHPHTYTTWEQNQDVEETSPFPPGGVGWRFSSVASPLSYQTQLGTQQAYGVIDRTNHARAVTGFAYQQAHHADLTDTPQAQDALDAIQRLEWDQAATILTDLVDEHAR